MLHVSIGVGLLRVCDGSLGCVDFRVKHCLPEERTLKWVCAPWDHAVHVICDATPSRVSCFEI